MVGRHTADWLPLLLLESPGRHLSRVIKWQVCWGCGQPSVLRASYTSSAGGHVWLWVKATGSEWGEGSWFDSLGSPQIARCCFGGGTLAGKRLCDRLSIIFLRNRDCDIKDPGELQFLFMIIWGKNLNKVILKWFAACFSGRFYFQCMWCLSKPFGRDWMSICWLLSPG